MAEMLKWFESLLTGFASVGNWLITPLEGFGTSPLVLASATGLLIFLGVAVGKWIFF